MTKRIELRDDSMNFIVDQIQRTISDLNMKRELLLNQIDLYDDLQAKIDTTSEKTMVFLGDGYFVEKTPEDTKKFLIRRIASIHEVMVGFNVKIKDAESTMDHISKFRETEFKDEKENNTNEDGLPFMDIQEQLDDDDNIESVKINNKIQTLENGSKNKELNDDELRLVDIQEELDEKENVKSIKTNNKFQEMGNKIEKENKDIIQHEPSVPNKRNPENLQEIEEDNEDQIFELLEDMGLTQPGKPKGINVDQDKLLDRIDQLTINADDKFKLKKICVEEYQNLERKNYSNSRDKLEEMTDEEVTSDIVENNLQEVLDTKDVSTSRKDDANNQLACEGNDLLELELIADKFDDTHNLITHADDEEWDFEFDDAEDEEEDIADELLYGNGKATFIPQTESQEGEQNLNNLLWEQIMDLRSKKEQANPIDYKKKGNSEKKSVRFSEKLEINEIENISEELKKIDHIKQSISRFRQNRLNRPNDKETEQLVNRFEKTQTSISESPCTDIVERYDSDIVERKGPVGDILERKGPVGDIIEREGPAGDMVEREGPTGDIIEREGPVGDIIERKGPVGDIIEREGPIGDIIEREGPIGDIIEREGPIGDVIEMEGSLGDIVEEGLADVTVDQNQPSSDIQYDSTGAFVSDANRPKLSKFKQMKAHTAPLQPKMDHAPICKPKIESFEISDIEQGKTRKAAIEESIEETEDNTIHVADTTLDYNSMQDDIDTMAKAYNLGMYDDDIMSEGPVVQHLDDFNQLNKIIESMPKRAASPSAKPVKPSCQNANQDFDPYLDQIGDENQLDNDDDDDAPVLSDILENDIVPPPDIEKTILDQEVTYNYHRLRQKLFFTKNHQQDNKEFEPIDEDGNNLRISRFKAAKYERNQA